MDHAADDDHREGDEETDGEAEEGHEAANGHGALGTAARLAKSAVGGAVGFVADKRFDRTPAGRARKAAERGDRTFLIRLDLDTIATRSSARSMRDPQIDDVIGTIEAEGWSLDNIEYITETDTFERTDADGATQRDTTERTSAVLLFRRV